MDCKHFLQSSIHSEERLVNFVRGRESFVGLSILFVYAHCTWLPPLSCHPDWSLLDGKFSIHPTNFNFNFKPSAIIRIDLLGAIFYIQPINHAQAINHKPSTVIRVGPGWSPRCDFLHPTNQPSTASQLSTLSHHSDWSFLDREIYTFN